MRVFQDKFDMWPGTGLMVFHCLPVVTPDLFYLSSAHSSWRVYLDGVMRLRFHLSDHAWPTHGAFNLNITSFVLDDEQSNGEVDEDEAKYLYDQIKGDGQIDDIEKALLENIKAKSKYFPALLAELL